MLFHFMKINIFFCGCYRIELIQHFITSHSMPIAVLRWETIDLIYRSRKIPYRLYSIFSLHAYLTHILSPYFWFIRLFFYWNISVTRYMWINYFSIHVTVLCFGNPLQRFSNSLTTAYNTFCIISKSCHSFILSFGLASPTHRYCT